MTEQAATVCIIEDSEAIRRLFGIILKKNGYEPVEFDIGQSAVNWLKDNKPAVVLCDDILPDINGSEIIKILRQTSEGRQQCVIAITGYALTTDRERYIAMGFDGYIPKPINTSTFIDEIREIIASKQSK